ncbi:MAG: PIN domain-containing protein [Planctomycetes bacterium]|nr:PIN domain-containing protein [Planctomycetota bacterium]
MPREDPASAQKRQRAQQILLSENWGWSIQVAAEFFVNATSPKRPFRLASADAAVLLETWLAFPTVPVTADILRVAIDYHQRFQLSYWDAAILASAKQMGCRLVYSEDFSEGQDYDGVTVVNPFAVRSAP